MTQYDRRPRICGVYKRQTPFWEMFNAYKTGDEFDLHLCNLRSLNDNIKVTFSDQLKKSLNDLKFPVWLGKEGAIFPNSAPSTKHRLSIYKVTKSNKTQFIGSMGQCWIWLRNLYGSAPAKELMDLGYKIEKVKK